MTIPSGSLPAPPAVLRIAAGRPVTAVWRNDAGGLTFRVDDVRADYVKVGPGDHAGEAARLRWARQFTAVPEVLGVGDGWLHTAGLPGRSAVDPYWVVRPEQAARAIGAGLRRLHDLLPVEACPFDWSVPARLAAVPARLRSALADAPPVDRLVVCHGDACAPNTLIDDGGRCSGHVDLDALGVADRWADIAVATMSLSWNYGEPCEDELLAAYGVERDATRIAYYRRLWEAPDSGGG
jgi:kanamycin kinase